jgi:biopolymer transport protein ExbD
MRFFQHRSADTGIHEPNMTPLIDVSLVLVVILMVATPPWRSSPASPWNSASRTGRQPPRAG